MIFQYKKTFKFLVIVKKRQFSRTNALKYNKFVRLIKKAFLDFKNTFMMPICQNAKLFEGWDVIAN